MCHLFKKMKFITQTSTKSTTKNRKKKRKPLNFSYNKLAYNWLFVSCVSYFLSLPFVLSISCMCLNKTKAFCRLQSTKVHHDVLDFISKIYLFININIRQHQINSTLNAHQAHVKCSHHQHYFHHDRAFQR